MSVSNGIIKRYYSDDEINYEHKIYIFSAELVLSCSIVRREVLLICLEALLSKFDN